MTIAPEYAFTFTSFDDGINPGGWQIKEEWMPPDAAARDFLLAGIRTDLGASDQVPLFPTIAERVRLPRRLEHRPLPDGRSAVWYSIAAGQDASGRPGNVFVTAFTLSAGKAATHRAIDLWRSSSLPEPFGHREVAVARCPPQPGLEVGTVSGEHSVSSFLLPDFPAPDRAPLLLVLLDAVAAAVHHQAPGITLLVEDADEAAAWIASICAFASPAWSARFTWSTWETPQSLKEKSIQSLHLVAVPSYKGSLPDARHRRLVVDVRRELKGERSDGDASSHGSGVWTIGGRTTPIGEWSRMAKPVMDVEPDALAATLLALRNEPGSSAAIDPTEGLHRLRGDYVPPSTEAFVLTIDPEPTTGATPTHVIPASLPFDRPWAARAHPQASTPAPSSWRETAKLISLDERSWARRHDSADDSHACESSREALSSLGLDPNGGFVKPEFLAIISPEADANDGTYQQLVTLAVHATGGRAPGRWERETAANLILGLGALKGSAANDKLKCRYMAEAFLASVRIDQAEAREPKWEDRRRLLYELFNYCTARSWTDVWGQVTSWEERLDETRTAREFVKGERR